MKVLKMKKIKAKKHRMKLKQEEEYKTKQLLVNHRLKCKSLRLKMLMTKYNQLKIKILKIINKANKFRAAVMRVLK